MILKPLHCTYDRQQQLADARTSGATTQRCDNESAMSTAGDIVGDESTIRVRPLPYVQQHGGKLLCPISTLLLCPPLLFRQLSAILQSPFCGCRLSHRAFSLGNIVAIAPKPFIPFFGWRHVSYPHTLYVWPFSSSACLYDAPVLLYIRAVVLINFVDVLFPSFKIGDVVNQSVIYFRCFLR